LSRFSKKYVKKKRKEKTIERKLQKYISTTNGGTVTGSKDGAGGFCLATILA